ncbi:MAG: HD domain-containing protein [Candidatus Schekmanbacteria bacterium]|nr:HD domain-containing protein [Candidatus Schekmanbacteria bacterium]
MRLMPCLVWTEMPPDSPIQLAKIAAFSAFVHCSDSLPAIVDSLLHVGEELTAGRPSSVFLFDAGATRLQRHGPELLSGPEQRLVKEQIEEGTVDQVLREDAPRRVSSSTAAEGDAALWIFPLKVGRQDVGGWFIADSPLPDSAPWSVSEDTTGCLLLAARQAAAAIERVTSSSKMEQKLAQLRTIVKVGRILTTALDSATALASILPHLHAQLPARAYLFYLTDPHADQLTLAACLCTQPPLVWSLPPADDPAVAEAPPAARSIAFGRGLSGWVGANGLPLAINDYRHDPRFPDFPELPGYVPDRALCVALPGKDRVAGVFTLCDAEQPFTRDDQELVTAFADTVASAWEACRAHERVRTGFQQTVLALAAAVESKDPYTHGHVERMAEYAYSIGEAIGFDALRLEALRFAAALHDVGMIGIRDEILLKRGKLTNEEYRQIQRHPQIGARIVSGIDNMEVAAAAILHHHERWNGSGYPDGLKGKEIPLEARILTIVDAFDAMTTTRPYSPALPVSRALQRLRQLEGIMFDPELVAVFSAIAERRSRVRPRLRPSRSGDEPGGSPP